MSDFLRLNPKKFKAFILLTTVGIAAIGLIKLNEGRPKSVEASGQAISKRVPYAKYQQVAVDNFTACYPNRYAIEQYLQATRSGDCTGQCLSDIMMANSLGDGICCDANATVVSPEAEASEISYERGACWVLNRDLHPVGSEPLPAERR